MGRGRKKKVRYIQEMPPVVQFSPRGKAGRPDDVELRVDHFEALKIADFLGYDQLEGATVMGLSRPSFGRILREARKIVADAIVNGKAIRIRVGDVQVGVRRQRIPHKSVRMEQSRSQEELIRQNILKFPEL